LSQVNHDCVERINALLAPHNTALASFITFGDGNAERIALMTQKADVQTRKKPVMFFASYCPMCGIKLDGSTS
jgi:hypothetical protein